MKKLTKSKTQAKQPQAKRTQVKYPKRQCHHCPKVLGSLSQLDEHLWKQHGLVA